MIRNFGDRLVDAVRERSPLCVGLDPVFDRLPPEILDAATPGGSPAAARADAIGRFSMRVVDRVAEHAACVKLQMAFFEIHGHAGMKAAADIVRHARDRGLLVIGDLKRGDIGSTVTAFATAYLGPDGEPGAEGTAAIPFDAITVNPYMGTDAISPFLPQCEKGGKGLFVLVRTSNPSSREIQDLDCEGAPVFHHVARLVDGWGASCIGESGFSSVGAVVGATFPKELTEARDRMPRTPFLVPGVGAQGATAEDVAGAFRRDGFGAVVNSSRGILYAFEKAPAGTPWEDAVAAAAQQLAGTLRDVSTGAGSST